MWHEFASVGFGAQCMAQDSSIPRFRNPIFISPFSATNECFGDRCMNCLVLVDLCQAFGKRCTKQGSLGVGTWVYHLKSNLAVNLSTLI
uniref:Uncharacterized protein n=1 Tax=Eutreptiella gymnastica TaxID=73025 RepID=A0A7S4CWF1_9EUGL